MKKNGHSGFPGRGWDLKVVFCAVGLSLLLLAVGMPLHASHAVLVQKVSVSVKNANLKQVIRIIERQTGFGFLYNESDVAAVDGITVNMPVAEIGELLDHVLRGTALTYSIRESTILISVKNGERQQGAYVTVHGRVTDDQGVPLAGVSVRHLKSRSGTSTNTDGYYKIAIPASEGVTLLFTYVGKEPSEIAVADRSEINVVMHEKVTAVGEVIVTGYQQIEKRQSTSAVSVVRTDDINQIGATSIEQMLQGQLAGLSVVTSSASPGAAPKVRVRGTATITGNADPLWVLDGVILENSIPVTAAELNNPDFMNTFNSVIGGISPNDIESITVLKDASATAIYGTRAANGVIVVTTKKGGHEKLNISYQHTSTVTLRPSYNDFDLLDSQQRVELTQQSSDEGLSLSGSVGMEGLLADYATGNITLEQLKSSTAELEIMNTDWFGILFRNAYAQTHSLSISGGSEKINNYTSLNYNNEQGSDKVSGYRNFNGMTKIVTEPFRGVELTATLNAGRRDRNSYFGTTDPFTYAVRTSRVIPLYTADGDYFYYRTTQFAGNLLFNIINEQNNTHSSSSQTDLKGMVNLSARLVGGLKYTGLYSYASSYSNSINWATEQSYYAASVRGYDLGKGNPAQIAASPMPTGGIYSESNYEQRTSLIRNGLEYHGEPFRNLSIDLLAGQEFRNTVYRGLSSYGYGYMHERGNIFFQPTTNETTGHIKRNSLSRSIPERSYISYYGVFSAMYNDRYIVNANVRFDGSNLFGSNPKYRYLPLWSVSAKWLICNESFLAGSDVVDELAIRASYGLRGNIVEDSSPQIIAQALPPNEYTNLLELAIIQPPNPNLKWETTSSVNIGLDFGFFGDRLRGSVDYYLDTSRDLIAYKDISSVSGFQSKYVNYADVRNHGVDLGLTGVIIKRPNTVWNASLNLGYVNNKVIRSFIVPEAQNLVKSLYVTGQVMEGRPVNAMFSYRFARLNVNGEPVFYDEEDNEVGSSDPNISTLIYSNVDNLKYEGTRDPIISGGLNNMVRVNDFTLSALLSFGFKYVARLPDFAYKSVPQADQNANASILKRWRNAGDEEITTIPRLTGGSTYFTTSTGSYFSTLLYNQSSETVVPGDYVRLRNVMIEYRLPESLTNRLSPGGRKLRSFAVKFQAQNLFVIKDGRMKGYDPETINYTTTGYGSLPLKPRFTLGVNINF